MPETCKWTVLYLVLSQISFVTVMTLRLALRLERIWNAYKLLVNQSNHNHPSYFWSALALAGHCCLHHAAPWHWAVAKPFISGWFVLRGALIQAAVDVFAGQKYCGHTHLPLCLGFGWDAGYSGFMSRQNDCFTCLLTHLCFPAWTGIHSIASRTWEQLSGCPTVFYTWLLPKYFFMHQQVPDASEITF